MVASLQQQLLPGHMTCSLRKTHFVNKGLVMTHTTAPHYQRRLRLVGLDVISDRRRKSHCLTLQIFMQILFIHVDLRVIQNVVLHLNNNFFSWLSKLKLMFYFLLLLLFVLFCYKKPAWLRRVTMFCCFVSYNTQLYYSALLKN